MKNKIKVKVNISGEKKIKSITKEAKILVKALDEANIAFNKLSKSMARFAGSAKIERDEK